MCGRNAALAFSSLFYISLYLIVFVISAILMAILNEYYIKNNNFSFNHILLLNAATIPLSLGLLLTYSNLFG